MQKKINFEIDYDFARKEYDIKKDIESREKNLNLLHDKLHKDITKAFPFFGKVMADIKSAKAEALANWTSSKKKKRNRGQTYTFDIMPCFHKI